MTRRLAITAAAASLVALALGAATLARWWPDGRAPDVSLSVFEPHAGGCAWSRYDVHRQRYDMIARFPADCAGVQYAWAPDLRSVLAWFAPDGESSQDVMLFRVDIATGQPAPLPLPPLSEVGEAQRYLIDRRGRILAFTLDQQRAQSTGEGLDVRVHAVSLENGTWRVVETGDTRCCSPGAPGIEVLALYGQARRDPELWSLQSSERLQSGAESFRVLRSERLKKALRDRLPPHLALPDVDGPWLALSPRGWRQALIFRGLRGESVRATGLAMLARVERATPLPGLTLAPTDIVRPMASGPYLLLTEWVTGASPHLYDMRTGDLLYRSKVATGVVFWPDPVPPRGD